MGDAKTRLGSLFAANGAQAPQGNDALRYVAPKEPSRGSQSATGAAQPAVQASAPAATNSVVFHTSVSLYQYDSATRGYAQVGGVKAQVGCVLVGAETTYAVLFYDAEKTPLCQVPLKAWNPTVQPRNFLNFYDEKRTNWSMKFATEDALVEFMKQVFLAKIHAEIWSSKRTIDASALWKQDLGASAIKTTTADDASGAPVAAGDRVRVEFKCWRVVGRASSPPNDVVTKYPPFEKTNDGETRKFRIGDGSERIKALDEGVIGMKRGGKRMILAPPGKTNGQDWYIVDVTLVDSRSGGGRRESQKSEEAPAPTPTPAEKTKRKSRSSVRENSLENEGNRGDIVPYQDESSGNASRHEMDMKELKLLQLEKELKMKEQMLAGGVANGGMQGQAQMQVPGFSTSYNGLGVGGAFSPYGSIYSPAQPAQGLMTPSGRPLDGMIMELHAKIDYLIRMAPGSGPGGSTPSFGGPVGATDVQLVLRGVERLAGENERLLLQINSQNQQYASYEKRCEELLKQNQRLQDEKRMADEKYQSMASLQLNYNAEISSLTSARDAAITQVNRIHSDYQQLLTAFYQKQQASTENEEQRNALEFERQSRVRLEKELQKETQTRSLVEQELTLVKKQLDVLMKMKESEVQSHRQEMEHQVQTLKASQQQEIEDRIKRITTEYQQQEKRLQQEWDAQMERQTTQARADLEKVQAQLEALTTEKQHTSLALEASQVRVRELEASLATQAAATIDSVGTVGLDEEEKRIYQEQIELLQQQVKELEAEKYERLQQDMDAGRLSSPSSSPRNRKKLEIVDDDASAKAEELMAAARAKEEAAERTLAMAEEIKREAEAVLRDQQSPSSNQDPSAAREKTVTLFKEAVNEMFFRFQDVFEDESYATASLEGRQVLTVVRKVLKQSTKDVIQRLQEEDEVTASQPAATSAPTPTPAPAPVSVPAASPSSSFSLPTAVAVGAATGLAAAAVVAAATDDNDDDNGRASNASSEGPPPPPELDETEPLVSALEASEKPDEQHKREEEPEPKEEDDEAEDTVDDGADDLLFGAASVSVPSAVTYPIVRRAADVSDDSDDDFDD